MYNLIIIWS